MTTYHCPEWNLWRRQNSTWCLVAKSSGLMCMLQLTRRTTKVILILKIQLIFGNTQTSFTSGNLVGRCPIILWLQRNTLENNLCVFFVFFFPCVGAEAVYGVKCHKAKPDCPSSICHSVLRESVSSLQSLHHSAAFPHLDDAAWHHDSHTCPLRERKGTLIFPVNTNEILLTVMKKIWISAHFSLLGTSISKFSVHLSARRAWMWRKHDWGLIV